MQLFLKASRFLLPVVFLGYAAIANVAILTGGKQILPEKIKGEVMKGGLTASIDRLYRDGLPHTEPSVGLIGAGRYLLLGEGRKGVVSGHDGWLFTDEEMRPVTDTMLTTALTQIKQVRTKVEAAGGTLVMVPLPAKVDIYRAQAADPMAADAMQVAYDAFYSRLTAAGLTTVDARATLVKARSETQVFLRTDTHWTVEGARAVAKAIAAVVPQGQDHFDPDVLEKKEFTGDLVSFVTSDALAPRVGLGPETAQPFVAVTDADVADDLTDIFGTETSIGTVLVGTSYSANETWSFLEALKIATQRDILNLAEEGRGPGVPMIHYLDSAGFRDTPPELVIWEFPVRYLSDPKLWPSDDDDKGQV